MAASRPSTEAPSFALRGVGKHFGGIYACRHIDLEFRAGEVLAILGENGAGKSTTVKCLHGLYQPDEGQVEIGGRAAHFRSPRDAEAAGISMIPQELDLFPELSIVENLFLGQKRPRHRWGAFDQRAMNRQAHEVMATLGVDVDVTAPVKTFSAATGRLVEIARALNRDARLIIMDEPTAALTDKETENLFEVIERLKSAGVSVIYITHRLNECFTVSDRIVVMRDGRLIRSGPTSEFTIESLVDAMVGRPLETLYSRHSRPIGDVVLEVRGLSLGTVFAGIDFEVRSGEVLGVSGLIGAGRSELAQAIYGIAPADRGEIVVDGRSVSIRSVSDALANGIAYLPEERRSQGLILPFAITANMSLSVLALFSRLGFVNRRREHDFAAESAGRFTVTGATLTSPVENLSGGNQQKVLIAKVLALDPKVVILDEPTRGVDVGAKSEVYRIIDDLASRNKAIVVISSEMNEVMSISDRIIVMHEGRISGRFDRDEFSQQAIGAAAAGQRLHHAA